MKIALLQGLRENKSNWDKWGSETEEFRQTAEPRARMRYEQYAILWKKGTWMWKATTNFIYVHVCVSCEITRIARETWLSTESQIEIYPAAEMAEQVNTRANHVAEQRLVHRRGSGGRSESHSLHLHSELSRDEACKAVQLCMCQAELQFEAL